MLEALFGLVLEIVLEVLGQLLFEGAAALGWESLKEALRRNRRVNPVLASVGQWVLGAAAGGVSLLVLPARLTEGALFPGISLLLSPLATGLIMDELGDRWIARGKQPPALFNFRAGASFAFGMALVRFLYFRMQVV